MRRACSVAILMGILLATAGTTSAETYYEVWRHSSTNSVLDADCVASWIEPDQAKPGQISWTDLSASTGVNFYWVRAINATVVSMPGGDDSRWLKLYIPDKTLYLAGYLTPLKCEFYYLLPTPRTNVAKYRVGLWEKDALKDDLINPSDNDPSLPTTFTAGTGVQAINEVGLTTKYDYILDVTTLEIRTPINTAATFYAKPEISLEYGTWVNAFAQSQTGTGSMALVDSLPSGPVVACLGTTQGVTLTWATSPGVTSTFSAQAAAGSKIPGPGALVRIETVRVGNPNNAPDTRHAPTGYGAVGHIYNIGKYEVTAGQYTAFLNAVAASDPYGLYDPNMDYDANPSAKGCNIKRMGVDGSYTYSVAQDWADRPVNCVSWGDAARFANWMHNGQPTGQEGLTTTEDGAYYLNGANSDAELLAVSRNPDARWAIPSEDEWYKAAYYDPTTDNYFDYATASNSLPGRSTADASGNNANYYSNGFVIGSPYYRTPVGEFGNSDSPYGTFDQNGNVWEWNETVIGSSRGLRGGSCSGYDYDLCLRHSDPPTRGFDYSVGFRLVEIPEPATLSLLALGGLALLRRRK